MIKEKEFIDTLKSRKLQYLTQPEEKNTNNVGKYSQMEKHKMKHKFLAVQF